MRPFESYFIFGGMALCFFPQWSPLIYITAFILALHLIFERPRWQLTLAYLGFPAIIYFNNSLFFQIICELFFWVAAAVACLFPVIKLPSPTGPYHIGFRTFHIVHHDVVDESHKLLSAETSFNEFIGRDYEVMARVYYPVTKMKTNDKRGTSPYMQLGMITAAAYAKFAKFPTILFSHLPLSVIEAVENAPILPPQERKKPLPLVVFSHGLGGSFECYSTLILEMASQGYAVLVVEHNDGSACLTKIRKGSKLNYYVPMPPGVDEFKFRNSQIMRRVDECRLAIAALDKYNVSSDSFLYGRLNMSQFACCGHSFGAATSLTLSHYEKRVIGVIAHDTWLFPIPKHVLAETQRHAPVLATFSEHFISPEYHMKLFDYILNGHDEASLFLIKTAGHQSYSDFALLTPVLVKYVHLGLNGTSNAREILALVDKCNIAFLNKCFKGEQSDILLEPSRFFPQIVSYNKSAIQQKIIDMRNATESKNAGIVGSTGDVKKNE